MKLLKLLTTGILFTTFSFASSGSDLANKLHISPSSKAMTQWEKVFTNKRKMRRLKINTLSDNDKTILKKYLIDHAADSPSPIAAGM